MNLQYWQAIAAFVVACGALYAIVTAPLLRTLKAEIGASEARMKGLVTNLEAVFKTDLMAMEKRLNERLTDKLSEHGERIRSLEEWRILRP